MFYKPLLFPLLIQVALTFLVLIRMYRLRFAEMRRKQIAPQDLATRQSARTDVPRQNQFLCMTPARPC